MSLFCTFEGIDNAGKSTVIKEVKDQLESNGFETVTTAEPSRNWTGKQVRRAIASETQEHPLVAFFLFMADRVKHIEETIKPALEDDKLVISDRFSDSTMVYQAIALEEYIENPKWFFNTVMSQWTIEPDITIYLDISVEESLARGKGGDVYEDEQFLHRVKEGYERHLSSIDRKLYVVKAHRPVESVVAEVTGIILSHLLVEGISEAFK